MSRGWRNISGPVAVIAPPANPPDDIETLCKANFVMKDGKVFRRP